MRILTCIKPHNFLTKPNFSYISETKLSNTNAGTIEECCGEFYLYCQSNQLVYIDSTAYHCHFGMASTTSGNIMLSGATWTVYIKQGDVIAAYYLILDNNFTFPDFSVPSTLQITYKLSIGDLVSSLWNKYVYRVYTSADGDVNFSTCKALCAFDSDNIGTRNGAEKNFIHCMINQELPLVLMIDVLICLAALDSSVMPRPHFGRISPFLPDFGK